MPSCLVLFSSICYVRSKAMSTLGKSFNLLGSSFDSLSVLRNLRVLPKAGSLDFEGWQAKRVSNCAACMPVCVRACGLRVRACVQVQLRSPKTLRVEGSPKGEGPCIRPFPLREKKKQVACMPCLVLLCLRMTAHPEGVERWRTRCACHGLRLLVVNLANVVWFRSRSLRHVPLGIIWRTDTPSVTFEFALKY